MSAPAPSSIQPNPPNPPSTPETPSIKLPIWAVGLIIFLLGGIVSVSMYVTETRAIATQADERLKNIETGVHQIWERLLDMERTNR